MTQTTTTKTTVTATWFDGETVSYRVNRGIYDTGNALGYEIMGGTFPDFPIYERTLDPDVRPMHDVVIEEF